MRLENEMSNVYFAIPLNIQYELCFCVICGERETRMSRHDNCRNMLHVMFFDFF